MVRFARAGNSASVETVVTRAVAAAMIPEYMKSCRRSSRCFCTRSMEMDMGKGNNSQKNDKKNKKPKQTDKKKAAKSGNAKS